MAQHEVDDDLEEVDGSNLIVNYLPDEMSEMVMYDMFAKYGEVDSVRIIRDRLTQAPRGYGFVKYKHPDSAQAAIENLDGLHIMHKKLKVAISRPGGVRLKANLFVGSLPPSFTEEDLTRLFSDFHPIIDVRILRYSDGTSKQCGFVRLDNDVLAGQAIQSLNGMNADGYRIQVKHAHGKRRRRPPAGMGTTHARPMESTEHVMFPNYAPPVQSFNTNPARLYDSPSFQPAPPGNNPNVAWPPPRIPMNNVVNPNLYAPHLYTPEYSSSTPPNQNMGGSMLLNQSPIIVALTGPQASPLLTSNNQMQMYTPPLQPVMVVTPPLTPNLVPNNFTMANQMPVLDLNASPPNRPMNMTANFQQMNLNPSSIQYPVPNPPNPSNMQEGITNNISTTQPEPKEDSNEQQQQ